MTQDSPMINIMNRLKELGALLLLLCLWLLILQPYGALNQYGNNNYNQFLSVDFLYIITTLLTAAFGFVLGFHIVAKSPSTRLLAQIYFLVSFINQCCWVTYFVHNTGLKEVFVTYSPEDIIKMFVVPPITLAWLIYFSRSTRIFRLYCARAGSHSFAVNPALSPTIFTAPHSDKPSNEINAHRGLQEVSVDSQGSPVAIISEKPNGKVNETTNVNNHENNNENKRREEMQTDTPQFTNSSKMGHIVEVTEKYNLGLVLRIIGIFLLFAFPIGTIAGVGVIIVGWRMSKKYSCSECGYPVSNKDVKFCTTCKSTLAPFQKKK